MRFDAPNKSKEDLNMPENVSNTSQPVNYAGPGEEDTASRYNRDVAQQGKFTVPESNSIPDDRADRELHQQDEERSSRRYVDYDSGVSATGHDSEEKDFLVTAAKDDRSNTSLYETVTPAAQGE
jgi:hypothetical protein